MQDLRPHRMLGGARSLPDARLPRIERAGTPDVRIADADPVELYRTSVTVVLPTRAVAERAPLPRGSGA